MSQELIDLESIELRTLTTRSSFSELRGLDTDEVDTGPLADTVAPACVWSMTRLTVDMTAYRAISTRFHATSTNRMSICGQGRQGAA